MKTKKKQKFSVTVVRIGYAFRTEEIEANSQEEANEIALDNAGDHEYLEKNAEYEIEGVSPKKVKVRVAWNKEAVDIMEEEGFDALSEESEINHNLDFDEKEFNTKEAALAYIQGIEDGNGWDEPMTEIV